MKGFVSMQDIENMMEWDASSRGHFHKQDLYWDSKQFLGRAAWYGGWYGGMTVWKNARKLNMELHMTAADHNIGKEGVHNSVVREAESDEVEPLQDVHLVKN